jgi:hypothetical protein
MIEVKKDFENYRTLCFISKDEALKNMNQIKDYFSNRMFSIEIKNGIDERKNSGYYVEYILKKAL